VSLRDVVADGFAYGFDPEDLPRAADRLRAVVRWSAIDEITQAVPDVDFHIAGVPPGLFTRVAATGTMGLVGNPARIFPLLGTGSVSFALSLSAPGYLPRAIAGTLGPIAGYPDAFVPADFGTIALHRTAVVVRGRTVRRALVPTAVAAADVTLVGLWRTFPPPEVDPATVMEPPNIVSLAPGLYADRVGPGDQLQRRAITLAVGQDKTLVRPAVIGERTVRLSDRVGLNIGHLLAIAPGDKDRAEYLTVTAIVPSATDDQPAEVTLAYPLARDHEPGGRCVRATPVSMGGPIAVGRAGFPGDRVIFVATLAGFANGAVFEIAGGPHPPEYQTVSVFQTPSDGDGYFRLPPIARVASIALRVQKGGLTTQQPVMSPNYRRYENQLDAVFP
jgi:hypothetical protein